MTTRRRFLGASAALAAGAFTSRRLVALAHAAPRRTPRLGTLVVLELSGGNDGLDCVVPFGDDAYHAARGDLAVTDGLRLDERVALHPALAALHRHYHDGRLAVVEGVGYPDPERSHFLSRDIWHTADHGGRRRPDGWLGRLADAHLHDPTDVVCIGDSVPYAARARRHPPLSLASAAGFGLLGGGDAPPVAAMPGAATPDADMPGRAVPGVSAMLRQRLAQAEQASRHVRAAAADHRPAADYPGGALAADLRLAAALITAAPAPRVITVGLPGFDTHSNQRERQARLLRELDGALAAFLDDLRGHDAAGGVAVLVFSEFGRRVQPNGSGGTDHGTAGPVFLLGDAVRGGLHGAPPSLAVLDDKGDLVHTTDFRRVYAALLQQGFGVDPAPLLDDGISAHHEPLPLM